MTITNSPDASSSQVHNIINRIENKLMIQRDIGKNQLQLQHPYYEPRCQALKANNINPMIPTNSESGSKNVTPANHGDSFNRRNKKALPSITTTRTVGNGVGSKVNMIVKGLPLQSQFNPYADENDSSCKFQLSKTFNNFIGNSSGSSGAETPNLTSRILGRSRFFGNDRTNLMQIDRLQTSNRSTNIINLRRENFHTFNITNNTILKTSTMYSGTHEQSSKSEHNQQNPVMFRNYDLNDEYWLNFE